MGDSRTPPPQKKTNFSYEKLLILYTQISTVRTLTLLTFLRRLFFRNSDIRATSGSILKFKGRDLKSLSNYLCENL